MSIIPGQTATASDVLSAIAGAFGDASDGSRTFDGSTTILGMAPVANVYTLIRDFYFDTLTINSGITIKTDGYAIYANTIAGSGKIKGSTGNNGGNAGASTGQSTVGAVGTAGAQSGSGRFKTTPGQAGSSGANQASSVPSPTSPSAVVGIGSQGATGGRGGNYTGYSPSYSPLSGSTPALINKIGIIAFFALAGLDIAINGTASYWLPAGQSTGGTGGGTENGYGNASGSGGGSGASGGLVFLCVKNWGGSFTIESIGGNGGNGGSCQGGSSGSGAGGGGAGGDGGSSIVIYYSKTWTGSYTLTGGTGGTAGTGGNTATPSTNGSNGNTGTSYEYQLVNLTR